MTLKELIYLYREKHNLSQRQFAMICNLSNGYISMLEKGINPNTNLPVTPTLPALKKIAKGMNITLTELLMQADEMPIDISLYENSFPAPSITEDYTTFPVIGDIAAGYDNIAAENWDGEKLDVPNSYLKGHDKNDFFVLCVKGDSMYPTYQDGDKVLILKQSTLNYSGQIGAIMYDGEYETLKKVEYVSGEDWFRMVPINPTYPPKKIEDADLEKCRILGIPKYLFREIKD